MSRITSSNVNYSSNSNHKKRRRHNNEEKRSRNRHQQQHHQSQQHEPSWDDEEDEMDNVELLVCVLDFGPAGSNISNNFDLHRSEYRFKYYIDMPMMYSKQNPSYKFLVAKVGQSYVIRASLDRSTMRYLEQLPKVYTKITIDFLEKSKHVKRDQLLANFRQNHKTELITAHGPTGVDTIDPGSVEMVWSDTSPSYSRKFAVHFRLHGSSLQFGYEFTTKRGVVRHAPMRLLLEVWADMPLPDRGYTECRLIDCCTMDLACFSFGSTALQQVLPTLCEYTPNAYNELPVSPGLDDIKFPNFRSPLIDILRRISPEPFQVINPNPNLLNPIISVVLCAPQSDGTREHLTGGQCPAMVVRGETHNVLLHKFHLWRDEPLRVYFRLRLDEPDADLKDQYLCALNQSELKRRSILCLDHRFTEDNDNLIDYDQSLGDGDLMVLWDSSTDLAFGLQFNVPPMLTREMMRSKQFKTVPETNNGNGIATDGFGYDDIGVDVTLGCFHRIRFMLFVEIFATTSKHRICAYDTPVEVYDKPDYLLHRLLGERWRFCKDQPVLAQKFDVLNAPVTKYIELTARDFYFDPSKDPGEAFKHHLPTFERTGLNQSFTIAMVPLQPPLLSPLINHQSPYLTPPLSHHSDDAMTEIDEQNSSLPDFAALESQ